MIFNTIYGFYQVLICMYVFSDLQQKQYISSESEPNMCQYQPTVHILSWSNKNLFDLAKGKRIKIIWWLEKQINPVQMLT